jgi:hypothetical protein
MPVCFCQLARVPLRLLVICQAPKDDWLHTSSLCTSSLQLAAVHLAACRWTLNDKALLFSLQSSRQGAMLHVSCMWSSDQSSRISIAALGVAAGAAHSQVPQSPPAAHSLSPAVPRLWSAASRQAMSLWKDTDTVKGALLCIVTSCRSFAVCSSTASSASS